jgi:hypothetical protein
MTVHFDPYFGSSRITIRAERRSILSASIRTTIVRVNPVDLTREGINRPRIRGGSLATTAAGPRLSDAAVLPHSHPADGGNLRPKEGTVLIVCHLSDDQQWVDDPSTHWPQQSGSRCAGVSSISTATRRLIASTSWSQLYDPKASSNASGKQATGESVSGAPQPESTETDAVAAGAIAGATVGAGIGAIVGIGAAGAIYYLYQ